MTIILIKIVSKMFDTYEVIMSCTRYTGRIYTESCKRVESLCFSTFLTLLRLILLLHYIGTSNQQYIFYTNIRRQQLIIKKIDSRFLKKSICVVPSHKYVLVNNEIGLIRVEFMILVNYRFTILYYIGRCHFILLLSVLKLN